MSETAVHLDEAAIAAGLAHVRQSPADRGTVRLVVARPGQGERVRLDEGRLDLTVGLVGDDWIERSSRRTEDGSAHPDMQLNIINARFSSLLAGGDEDRMALAGDQLHVDLDLSAASCPPGTRLRMGTAVVEVTEQPHTGCVKFRDRFGKAALKAVASPSGMEARLRGLCARVVEPGVVRPGDAVTKLSAT